MTVNLEDAVSSSRCPTGLWPCLAAIALLAGCAPAMRSGEVATSSRARDAYIRERARAGDPSIARWSEAGEDALRAPMAVGLPYVAFYDVNELRTIAGAYAFDLGPGGRLQARFGPSDPPPNAFFELFLQTSGQLRLVDAGLDRVATISRDGGRYLLRVQPRLGTVGTLRLSIEGDGAAPAAVVASGLGTRTLPASRYVFPVEGRDQSAIRSVWGDPRGGGRRHEGVDIFAPRGTPVLAASDGVILAVRNTEIGGRVIWMQPDGENLELYYAHLDRQDVRPGERVRAGAVIGLVGNTGNARSTPPHLHFGVYRTGGRVALDPTSWLERSAPVLAGVPAGRAAGQPQ